MPKSCASATTLQLPTVAAPISTRGSEEMLPLDSRDHPSCRTTLPISPIPKPSTLPICRATPPHASLHAYLGDTGFAKAAHRSGGESRRATTGRIMCSPGYADEDVINGQYSESTDGFAVGRTLLVVLTQRDPVDIEDAIAEEHDADAFADVPADKLAEPGAGWPVDGSPLATRSPRTSLSKNGSTVWSKSIQFLSTNWSNNGSTVWQTKMLEWKDNSRSVKTNWSSGQPFGWPFGWPFGRRRL